MKIKVVGTGGAGCKIIDTMIKKNIKNADLIAINSDQGDLQESRAKLRLQIGRNTTKGLSCGGDPDIGREAAYEDEEIISDLVYCADAVFIVLGIGGGTGTGSAPVIAETCKRNRAVTVAVVSYPFTFEGPKRKRQADEGINNLKDIVDKLIVIQSDSIVDIEKDSIMDCFAKSDEAICQALEKEITSIEKENNALFH